MITATALSFQIAFHGIGSWAVNDFAAGAMAGALGVIPLYIARQLARP
jgi:hypothetical protein